MSQDNRKSVTIEAVFQDRCFYQLASYSSSDPRSRVIDRRSATEVTVAEVTLRAGGRVMNVAMRLDGGTDSRVEVLSSERLSLEQWSQLCDTIMVLTHNMILMDYPNDGD